MELLDNMRNDHIRNRGWNDIGQNLTIFPDGKIGLCRAIDITPAGIFGANAGGICIENVGDFNDGGDVMTPEQKEAIVKTNAVLCIKFNLRPLPHQVVYHHWYDTKGNRFSDMDIDSGRVLRNSLQKTCPGTNFFCASSSPKGNTIQCALANFYPPVANAIAALQQAPAPAMQPMLKRVIASTLNVRAGRSPDFPVIRKLSNGMQIQVFQNDGDWSRVSANAEEWVSTKFLA